MTRTNSQDGWDRWVALCDAAMVAPDTRLPARDLAIRYRTNTGEEMTAEQVEAIMDYESPDGMEVGTVTLPKGWLT